MTRAPTREPRFGQPIVELGKWRFEAQAISERQPLTIIVTVEVLASPERPSIATMIACCANSCRPTMSESPRIFAHWAPVYRERGYWPRPITLGTKACHVRDWQRPDAEISAAELASWLTSARQSRHRPAHGQPVSRRHDARRTRHRPRRIRAHRARASPRSAQRPHRQEGRGLLRPRARRAQQSRVQGSRRRGKRYGKVAECLFVKKLCVIPPTIHPDTGQAYRWIGRPLHEVDFDELPIVEMDDA